MALIAERRLNPPIPHIPNEPPLQTMFKAVAAGQTQIEATYLLPGTYTDSLPSHMEGGLRRQRWEVIVTSTSAEIVTSPDPKINSSGIVSVVETDGTLTQTVGAVRRKVIDLPGKLFAPITTVDADGNVLIPAIITIDP